MGFKIPLWQHSVGSSPTSGIMTSQARPCQLATLRDTLAPVEKSPCLSNPPTHNSPSANTRQLLTPIAYAGIKKRRHFMRQNAMWFTEFILDQGQFFTTSQIENPGGLA